MNGFLSSLGQVVLGPVQSAADAATEAFYVIAGELLVLILLLAAIFVWGIAVL